MRTPARQQSHFRYPLNRILASEGAVRVLRELARHGGEWSVPSLARATKLSAQAIRNVLMDLTTIGIVESVGQGRAVLYRLQTAHPLRQALAHLFEEEKGRVSRVFASLREAVATAVPEVLAVWVYGSTARGDRVTHHLLAVDRCDRDDADAYGARGVDYVSKLLDHAFSNGVGAVDDEQALWSTQFG